MRRRLTLTIVGVVAAALVVAGLGTLFLARAAAREQTRVELVEQARALAGLAEGLDRRPVLAALRRSLSLEGAELVPLAGARAVGPGRRRATSGPSPVPGPLAAGAFPDGGDLRAGDVKLLRSGAAVSGWRGDVAYAAAPVVREGRPVAAVVLTREQPSGLGTALPWFLVSACLALGVAAVAADRLARRFARPVIAAEQAARRIAAGDLKVRVDPGGPGAEAELARLAASINTMAADLERAQGLQRQFLLSVSHELRTPLTSVRGFAEAIADGAAPDTRRAAEVIGAEARRLERLVGDLLELATLDARRFSLDIRPVDVAEVVSVTAEGFRPAAAAAGVELEIDTGARGTGAAGGRGDGAPALVAAADPERLAQVVANLTENALKFATNRIVVTAAREERPAWPGRLADAGGSGEGRDTGGGGETAGGGDAGGGRAAAGRGDAGEGGGAAGGGDAGGGRDGAGGAAGEGGSDGAGGGPEGTRGPGRPGGASGASDGAGGAVVVSVSDDGPGMSGADLPHVFDRLFQSSRPPARQVGSGLGLAIVAELAAAMGATVQAESRPGATRMVVRLRATGDGPSSWWPEAGSSPSWSPEAGSSRSWAGGSPSSS